MALRADLSTTTTTSGTIDGYELLGGAGSSNLSSAASYQVKYGSGVTTGNFSVTLEAGFNDGSTVTYGTVATITQTDVNKPVTLPIGPSLTYRFVHGSGVAVRVLLG